MLKVKCISVALTIHQDREESAAEKKLREALEKQQLKDQEKSKAYAVKIATSCLAKVRPVRRPRHANLDSQMELLGRSRQTASKAFACTTVRLGWASGMLVHFGRLVGFGQCLCLGMQAAPAE